MARKAAAVLEEAPDKNGKHEEHEKKPEKGERLERLVITAPKMEVLTLGIRGTAPLVLNRFSAKAMEMMKEKQAAGSQAKKGRQREAKDFQQCYEEAKHVAREGWLGFHAGAIRTGAISACRLVGFKMTLAKLSIFCLADGYDRVDGVPLVRITKGEPRYFESPVRNESGVADIRPRPLWDVGWEATLRIRYDGDVFKAQEVANLVARVGEQVGIGEGRADSRDSPGVGWGFFSIIEG